MEPTLSFWDCGEFIAAAFKMEVGHQPGAPFFLMLGNFFSLLAAGNTAKVAYWINFLAVLSSAATVMFLFWTITAIGQKVVKEQSNTNHWTIMIAGIIGASAYAFSDTFWFSAVEAEVYALSTLCTAVVFWAILKWEQELNDKWLVFIAFIIGLSIGIHLLSLLAIPAITLIYYFRKTEVPSLLGTLKAFFIGCVILGFIQFGIIQYFVLLAAKFDQLFVNQLGFWFGSGALVFLVLVAATISYFIRFSAKKNRYKLNLAIVCLTFILFGYSSYFMIVIRANAKPFVNLSNPDTPVSLHAYLSREQYGDKPLIYGQFFDAETKEIKEKGISYRKGENRYEASGKNYERIYDHNTIFPRTYSDKPEHVKYYRNWLNMSDEEKPGFAQNLKFFTSYQLGFMYWRYFGWNFIGRQNDIQGHGSINEGNWMSGIKPLDQLHLDNQEKLPFSITNNPGYNLFYGLPCILGIIGLFFIWRRNRNYALVLGTLFFCTGIAIILYINQDPLQLRERDYAYVGSFYTFAILIGFGFIALKDCFGRLFQRNLALAFSTLACAVVPTLMAIEGWDDHDRSGKTTALEMAKNYLNSCEPNAILFTNADNDTYPLWYAQEVEGIRTDVRVVNLQFLSSEAYISQMKRQQYKSAPLPISMQTNQYQDGVRDYLLYYDYGIKDSVELKDLLAVLTSDEKEDKLEMRDGTFENFLPTQNLKISVNPNKVIATGTLKDAQRNLIADKIEWKLNKNHVLKSDLAMFDIIANNNWKRPVYFASALPDDTYLGLDRYLYLEGFAYRLLPLKPASDPEFNKADQTHSDLAFNNYLNKFELKGFKSSKYLDPESRRVLQSTISFGNTLAQNLWQEGKKDMAKAVVEKSLRTLPLNNASITDTLNKVGLIQNLYRTGHLNEATALVKDTKSFIENEFDYLLSIKNGEAKKMINDIRIGFYVLQQLEVATNQFKQEKLSGQIKFKLQELNDKFVAKMG